MDVRGSVVRNPGRRDTVRRKFGTMSASTEEPAAARPPSGARPPVAAHRLVPRGELFDRLSAARPGEVVLVCAPAGSGKSTVVRSWVHGAGFGVRPAWLTVERVERDAQRFWLSLIDALARAAESVEHAVPSPGFRGEIAVERLLSDLDALATPVVLVIDDLHELHSADALGWLEQFLARLPSRLLVVLVTREDPRLGLHRLRLAGGLSEIRGTDLRFSLEETRQLLRAEGIALSDAGVALLHERTEGWAAGLRLAVLSLARHTDPERFVREFSGSERTVADYLLAEVLERQPPDVREMLLRTSVLDQVSGGLADFLTGGSGAERILQQLEDENAFVSSLDASRSLFRYHHLFADLLRLELRRVAPESIVSLHRAAAQWYEQRGDVIDAIRHAQRAGDWSLASRLLADSYFDLALGGRIATVRELLSVFPDDAADDPELAVALSAVRLLEGDLEESAAYVEFAQQTTAAVAGKRRNHFAVHVATMRLAIARWRGDLDAVREAFAALDQALASLSAADRALAYAHRATGLQNLGVAELWSGEVGDAQLHLEEALSLAQRTGHEWLEISPRAHLAVTSVLAGEPLLVGLRQSEDAVAFAEARGWGEDAIIVTALATSALALVWLGRFPEAAGRLERAEHVLQPGGEPGTELIVRHARGLMCLADRRFEPALSAFRAADRMQALLTGEHALTSELRARVLQTQIAMGETTAVRAALATVGDEERQRTELRIATAAMHLADGDPERAVDVLAPVLEGEATSLRQPWATIEASLLDGIARSRLRDHHGAEQSVERALDLAEPEGIILPFLLADVQGLLERHPRHRTAHWTLLRTVLAVRDGASAPARIDVAPLDEELSDAELRVVRYLPSNLKAPEIAAELFVSTNTVRTHIRHIYAKLGAHDRDAAVARARELGLVAPSLRSR